MRAALTLCCLFATLAAVELPDASALRAKGPEGLVELGKRYDAEIAAGTIAADTWDVVFTAVAAQRYAREARLFWHTDFPAAQQAARASGRPILSLRLLGRLDDETSCANSRFFRVLLYPDPALRRLLHDEVVLHWSSERPVPQVTIDYGNGRVVRTTVTGNSCHYLLDAEGRVLDALPGLYAADAFARALAAAIGAPREAAARGAWHADEALRLDRERASAFAKAGIDEPTETGGSTDAADAGDIALSKALVQRPLLRAIGRHSTTPEASRAMWMTIGKSRLSLISEPSLALFYRLHRGGDVGALVRSLAADSARNELSHHARIHHWLAKATLPPFVSFNEKVYRDLFLTPADDPWLGLDPDVAFSALPDNGVVAR